ncbi:hypothetical protein YB2330_005893 [Saitoella coloradoensis]
MSGLSGIVSSDQNQQSSQAQKDQGRYFSSSSVYGSKFADAAVNPFEMAEDELPADSAYRFVHDELALDGNPFLNLASFVTTYMEPQAEKLMLENLNKNFIDFEEYPATAEIESRCVNMLARLFNAPIKDNNSGEAVGVSTIGSSEAVMLAVLAAKRRWQHKRRAEGKSTEHPNIVMSSAVQVVWEKAARYLEVEEKYQNVTETRFVLDPKQTVDAVDENTILICAILGSTYTGHYEDVEEIDRLLGEKNKKEGLDVGIHVDAASGGFVAPFVKPDLKWDFRLPNVISINASGHKYGLAYPGVGWALWRSKEYLPEDILFTINYLGSPQVSFTLNFSKSAVQVIAQYYQFLRLGKNGYRAIMQNLTDDADYFANTIEATGRFTILSERSGKGLPLVAFKLKEKTHYDEFDIASHLRSHGGWIVPAYTMAPSANNMKLLRVVFREDFTRHRVDLLVRDLNMVLETLDKTPKEVVQHMTETQKQGRHARKGRDGKKVHSHDKHSLQGKTGKTHGVC